MGKVKGRTKKRERENKKRQQRNKRKPTRMKTGRNIMRKRKINKITSGGKEQGTREN
jgi:hypothetical protein